jgi:hypothetical protein
MKRLPIPPPDSAFALTPADLHRGAKETEAVVSEQIREFLALHGWLVLRWQTGLFAGWSQVQSEAAKAREQGRPFNARNLAPTPMGSTPLGRKSFPDLIALRPKPEPEILFIETKRTANKPDADQARTLEKLRRLGFRALYADGLTLGLEPFREWYVKNFR